MKLLLFIIIGIFIAANSINWDLPFCNVDTIKQNYPPKIFFETTIDGPEQKVQITRFFHNKVGVYANDSAKCYLNFLDPRIIYESLGIVVLIFIATFIYKAAERKYLIALGIFLLTPFVIIIFGSPLVFIIIIKIFAIIGLALLLKLR